jgi:hypothetical protein
LPIVPLSPQRVVVCYRYDAALPVIANPVRGLVKVTDSDADAGFRDPVAVKIA